MGELREKFDEIDLCLRQGDFAPAAKALGAILAGKIKRADYLELAALARRTSRPEIGIKLLAPLVRPRGRKAAIATSAERAEYAACLVRLGAFAEAMEILESVTEREVSSVPLFRAHALISHWRYREAVPELMGYLERENDPYWRRVTQVNLASAYIFLREGDKAADVLESVRGGAREAGNGLLYMNVLHLTAALRVYAGDFAGALKALDDTRRHVRETISLDGFLVRKWEAIARFLSDPKSPGGLGGLRALREEAVSRHHWETVRECDRFRALGTGDADLFWSVYFGTPFEAYREELLRSWGQPVAVPRELVWAPSGNGGPSAPNRLLVDGRSGKAVLKPGQLLFRLLQTLASDFYRPLSPAALSFSLFPGEHFNPESSIHRVHAAVHRLRGWLSARGLPFTIEETGGAYRLTAMDGHRLAVPARLAPLSRWKEDLDCLKSRFSGQPFSRSEASALLKKGSRTTTRILKQACEGGEVRREGAGPAARYRFGG